MFFHFKIFFLTFSILAVCHSYELTLKREIVIDENSLVKDLFVQVNIASEALEKPIPLSPGYHFLSPLEVKELGSLPPQVVIKGSGIFLYVKNGVIKSDLKEPTLISEKIEATKKLSEELGESLSDSWFLISERHKFQNPIPKGTSVIYYQESSGFSIRLKGTLVDDYYSGKKLKLVVSGTDKLIEREKSDNLIIFY